MKVLNNKNYFFLLVTIGIITTSLISCASMDHNMHKYDFNESSLWTHSSSLPNNQLARISAQALPPKEHSELTNDEYERLGDIYFSKGNAVMAFVQYEKSLRINPNNARVFYKRGLLFVIEKMYEDAIEEFQKVLGEKPDHALAHYGLGLAFFQMKKHEKAERHLQEAIELDTTLWKGHNLLGVVYDYKGQHEMAIQEYEAAIALNPERGLLYNNIGLAFSAAGDHEKAVDAFNNALQTESSHRKIYNNLGVALSKLGRYEEALETFRKGGDEAQAYNNLGCIYLWQGKYEKAIQSFEKAIVFKPTFYFKANDNLKRCRISQLHGVSFDSKIKTSNNTTSSGKLINDIMLQQLMEDLIPYKVRKGDTPYDIAKSHNMKLADFLKLNNLTTKSLIYSNQILLVKSE